MAKQLPPLTPCEGAEDPCVPPDSVSQGTRLRTTDPTSGCVRELENVDDAIPHTDGTQVKNRDGSEGDEIVLSKLMNVTGSFPYLMGTNGAGALLRHEAPASCRPHVMVGQEGSWSPQLLEQNSCFEEICEENPTQFAGWVQKKDCENKDRWCLVRFDQAIPEPAVLYFQSTSCIQLTGSGTEGDPYKFSPKISADAGNQLECRDDGLYAPCCVQYGTDPLA